MARKRMGGAGAVCVVAVVGLLWLVAGCSGSGEGSGLAPGEASEDAPRLITAEIVDADGNGADEGDIVLLQFDREVVLQGTEPTGILPDDQADSFGEGAVLEQSVPGSDRVEVRLGSQPELSPGAASTPGVTKINVVNGAGVVQVEGTNGFRAAPAKKSIALADSTAAAPVLVAASFADADADGAVGAGDLIVASFDKPISVPALAAVADNFLLPVAGDSFGAGAALAAASSQAGNRAARIVLGAGAVLTVDRTFSAAAVAAGSPSGLVVAAAPTITDTVVAAPVPIAAGAAADIGALEPTFFGNGRPADAVLGGSAGGLTAQGLESPAGVDAFTGNLTLGGTDFAVNLLFVADRGNDRVLIFENFPGGSFAAASWVLGQPDFTTSTSDDPLAEADAAVPTASNLEGPADVAFDAASNRLFVADTGNHRILVWNDLFFESPGTATVEVESGRAASFVLGQASFGGDQANRGASSPGAQSFSSPGGLDVDGGRLAVADTGNSRVLIYNPLPASADALPSAVLGQADFSGGAANRGGIPAAETLSAPGDVFLSTFLLGATIGALFVADTGNHRVLGYPTASLATGAAALVVLGQPDFLTAAPALSAAGLSSPSGVAGSAVPQPERLYVADRGNHRVMSYAAPLSNGQGGVATGQADPASGLPNRGGAPGAGTLNAPAQAVVLGTILVVSDAGNNRVLAFGGPSLPFGDVEAFLVLGQASFTTTGPGGGRFRQPLDVLLVAGKLILSDTGNHRVLIYNSPPLAGDPDPDVVLGQADIFSTAPNQGGVPTAATLNLPSGLATDGTRLAVADSGNHRVLIWVAIPAASGVPADVILGQATPDGALPDAGGVVAANAFNTPVGLAIDENRLVVVDRDNHRVLIFNGFSALAGFDDAAVAVGQDDFDDHEPNRGGGPGIDTLLLPREVLAAGGRLYIADTGNHRVLFFSPAPNRSGGAAEGVFGQVNFTSAVAAGAASGTLLSPMGLALDGASEFLAIADSGHHRIVFQDDIKAKAGFPAARGELGQENLSIGFANRGQPSPSPATLRFPAGLFYNGHELVAADTGNSRITSYR